MASTSGSAPAERTLMRPISPAIAAVPAATGSKRKVTPITAQENTTMPRWAPLRSASQPHAAGANTRASGGSASTNAISPASSPRRAR